MGYTPGLQPGGGSGFTVVQVWWGWVSSASAYTGNPITGTLPSDTKFIKIKVFAGIGSQVGKQGSIAGEAFIDCSTGDIEIISAGARMNVPVPLEHISSQSINLIGNMPVTLVSLPEHQCNISAYSGPGNTFTISATGDDKDDYDPLGSLGMNIFMEMYRQS